MLNKNNKEVASYIENNGNFNKLSIMKNNNIPFVNALLSSNIFGVKKVSYKEYDDLKDFGEYGKSRYLNSVSYKIKEIGSNQNNYLNYSVYVRATRPLCQKAFKMLMAVIRLSQEKGLNDNGEVEFRITEIFDIFKIDQKSRTSKLRQEICAQLLALSSINMKYKVINTFKKLNENEFDSFGSPADYETGDFALFEVSHIEGYEFKMKLNKNFYNMYSFQHWKTIDLDEYNLLTSDIERSFFRFINTKDYGGDINGVCHYHTKLEKFYNEVRLNDYVVKEANKKIKITLASLKEKGFIKDYKFNTPSKTLDITFITKKERVMKGLEGMNKTTRDNNQYMSKKQRRMNSYIRDMEESMKYL